MNLQKLLTAAFLTATSASATVLWVNDDAVSYTAPGRDCTVAGYATIQAAVNAAIAGDAIHVCLGVYVKNMTVGKSNLTVSSTERRRSYDSQVSRHQRRCVFCHATQRHDYWVYDRAVGTNR
jgi:hypothetical protein